MVIAQGLRTFGALFLILLETGSLAIAQQPAVDARRKPEVLFRLVKFVEWPAGRLPPSAPLVIGVVGDDAFKAQLSRAVLGETAGGHPFQISNFGSPPNRQLKLLQHCHVLFISPAERGRMSQILSAVRGASVLTVSEGEGFVGRGGMVGLVTLDGRLSMEIDPHAADAAGLKVSSRVLRVAKVLRASEAEVE